LKVLESVEDALPLCRDVRIDRDMLEATAAAVAEEQLGMPTWDFPVLERSDPELLASQIILFNAINFCYWGEPKWQVEISGQWLGGSLAMLGAIQRAFLEGIALNDPRFLAELPKETLLHILRGRGRLQLLEERLIIWRELGQALLRDGFTSPADLIAAGGGDALGLVQALQRVAPSWHDSRTLCGKPVYFYKRAQLAVAMLFEVFAGQGFGSCGRMNKLTVFADYRIPEVLRRLGILVYSEELAGIVDRQQLIPAGSPREVEIRTASVWAGELLRRALVKRMPAVLALQIDHWLWQAGRSQEPGDAPHHRTVTTSY
jgi:hypothetical protein